MNQRSNMRVPTRPPKVEWRMVAVTSLDPAEYARQMQDALNALSSEGFNIVAQYGRGVGQIIMANRQVADTPHPPGPIPGPTMPPPRRMEPTTQTPTSEEEFIYHFETPGKEPSSHRESFSSMVEALRLVRQHVDGDGTRLPRCLVAVSASTFDVPAIGALLKTYAEELASQPPKQVD